MEFLAESGNVFCGDFPFKSQPVGHGLRVNCRDVNKLFSEIQFKANAEVTGSLEIAEFEVHSFGEKFVVLSPRQYKIFSIVNF